MRGEAGAAPAVSVVIPTYNRAGYILETLGSVFAQTFTDYEVIVVNDGSPDDTRARLKPLAQAGRIRYVEQANGGKSLARNRGVAEARGEFIAFLDDDDLWPVEKLAWQVAVLRAEPETGVVYGQREEMEGGALHPGETAPEGKVFERFVGEGWIHSPGQVLIRRNLLERTGGFDLAIWGTEDWDLWLRLARETSFRYRARPALIYRRHAENASKNFLRMWRDGHTVIRKIFRGTPDPETGRLRRLAERFVDGFAADDGFVYAYQLMDACRLRAAATALLQIGRIRGWRGPNLLYCRAWYRLLRLCLQND